MNQCNKKITSSVSDKKFFIYLLQNIIFPWRTQHIYVSYPEWWHTQSPCLVCGRLRVRFAAAAAPICTVQVALRGCCTVKGGGKGQLVGSTVSGVIVRIAGCDRRELGVAHWSSSGSITVVNSCLLTPQTVVVDSLLGGSWP